MATREDFCSYEALESHCTALSALSGVATGDLVEAITNASELMWALTGRQFGAYTETVRPDLRGESASWFDLRRFPVTGITEVKIDGATMPSSAYWVRDGRLLVRTDETSWPQTQKLYLDDTEDETFSVTLTWGAGPPAAVVAATRRLACELLSLKFGGHSGLPDRVRSTVRQGISMEHVSAEDLLQNGRTGIYEIDFALETFNRDDNAALPAVMSPDIGWNDHDGTTTVGAEAGITTEWVDAAISAATTGLSTETYVDTAVSTATSGAVSEDYVTTAITAATSGISGITSGVTEEYVTSAISAATSGISGAGAHSGLSGLNADDHPQYALADGSRGSFAATGHGHGYGLGSPEFIRVTPSGVPLVEFNTGSWDTLGIREPGQSIYDPETDQWIITYSGRRTADGFSAVGAILSTDGGATWTAHPQNPIAPVTDVAYWGADMSSEDPYIAKTIDGVVWRDSSNRALMFAEEKDGTTQRGINLWRSGAGTLSDWTLFGEAVLPAGGGTLWDATDRDSPVVIHDGTQLVMLYEGRNLPSQKGQVGYATSDDEGATWTVAPDPIIVQLPASWHSSSIVPDDIIKVGDTWTLICHGSSDEVSFDMGRWSTTDDPADWDSTSFTEDAGNPFTAETSTIMCWGNDPRRAVWLLEADEFHIEKATVSTLGIDTTSIESDITALQGDVVNLQSWSGTLSSQISGLSSTVTGHTAELTSLDARIDLTELATAAARAAGHAAANAAPGQVTAVESWLDIYDLVGPGAGFEALDVTSQLDHTAGAVLLVPDSPVVEGLRGAILIPSSPPVSGAELVGVLASGVTVSGAVPADHVYNLALSSGGPSAVPSQSYIIGAGADRWRENSEDGGVSVRSGTVPGAVDIYLSAHEVPFGLSLIMFVEGADTSDFPPVTIDTVTWVYRLPTTSSAESTSNHVKRWGTALDRLPGVMLAGSSTAAVSPGVTNWIYTHAFLPEAVTVDAMILDPVSTFDADLEWCIGYTSLDGDGQPTGAPVVLGTGTATAPISAGRQVLSITSAEIPAGRFAYFQGFKSSATGNRYIRAFPAVGLEGGYSLPTAQSNTQGPQTYTASHGGSLTPPSPMSAWTPSNGGFQNLCFFRLRVVVP